MNTSRNLFKRWLAKILILPDIFIPKNKKVLIFTTRGGGLFYDNSKYLFLSFLKDFSSEFKIFWCCLDKEIYKKLLDRIDRKNLIYQYSPKGIWTILRAKVIFLTHGTIRDFNLTSKKRYLILLWHAVNFKSKFLLREESIEKKKKLLKKFSRYTLAIASSEKDKENIYLCTGIDTEKIKITGLPRHDFLFEAKRREKTGNSNNKIVLYAPTFRKETKTIFFPFYDLDIKTLKFFLEKNNIKIYLRPHFLSNKYPFHIEDDILRDIANNIVLLDWERYDDTIEFMPNADILITDYSSIFIDFLILDRPIIFVPYDRAEYKKERELLYNYDEITPGPKITTQKEFLYWIEQFIQNPQLYFNERENVRKNFFTFSDGKAYIRIYNELKQLP